MTTATVPQRLVRVRLQRMVVGGDSWRESSSYSLRGGCLFVEIFSNTNSVFVRFGSVGVMRCSSGLRGNIFERKQSFEMHLK